jgi:transcriptional regulator with GAF, ATPase, and Fis domain
MFILAGEAQFAWEGTNRTVKGEILDISLTWSVIPGYENDLSRVIVSIADMTERKRAQEATQRRNAELTVLNKIGQALSKLAEPSKIFEAIFTGIGQVLDNRNLYIALYDRSNQYISFPVYTLHGKHRSGADRPFSNGITEHVIRTNTPLLIKRDLAETLEQRGINMIGVQSRSFLAVPVRAGDKVIGVIALQDYDRENVYDEHHVELLTTIAAQATVALENARLYNEVQQELAERKRTEKALRESEKKFKTLFEIAPVGISVLDREHKVVDTNYALQRITGFRKD